MWWKMLYKPSIMKLELPQTVKAKTEVKRKFIPLASTVASVVTHRSNVGEDQTQSAASAISLDMKL
jgi:hypothetical protein